MHPQEPAPSQSARAAAATQDPEKAADEAGQSESLAQEKEAKVQQHEGLAGEEASEEAAGLGGLLAGYGSEESESSQSEDAHQIDSSTTRSRPLGPFF